MRVAIAGGGTAGHVNPAVAIARALTDHDVVFVGTRMGAEARIVPDAGFPLEFIEVRGFDRARLVGIGATAWVAWRAVGAARRLLRRIAPDVVVGMGGYVSLPVCLAARRLRIPIVVHEQNIIPGLANRICARLATRVATSFEETVVRMGPRAVHTGNPVAHELVAADLDIEHRRGIERFGLDPRRKTLLVFGGSQGARRINDSAHGLRSLWRDRSDRQVVHILGTARAAEATEEDADDPGAGLVYKRVPYVERMIEAYAVADLALCRGGATTIAELCVAGVPSVIVPYPYHRDRQQELHGRVLERAGAAELVLDAEASSERLAVTADRLLADDAALSSMSKAALAIGKPDAAETLARVIEEVAA